MLLYIADSKRIQKYELPEEIDESFLFKYIAPTGENEYFISIYAQEGNWFFKNTEEVLINNGPLDLSDTHLTLNLQSRINIGSSTSSPLLFCKSRNSNQSAIYKVTTGQITIGSDERNLICYKNSLTVATHANIIKQNNHWYLVSGNELGCDVYLNNLKIKQSLLKRGDVIFINGLKIIWMEDFFKIEELNNQVRVSSELPLIGKDITQDNDISESSNEHDSLQLYRKEDYFYHKPRIKRVSENMEINIESPPRREQREEMPMWLQLGSRITMLAFSGVMVFNAINTYQRTGNFSQVLPMVIISVTMVIGSLLLPTIMVRYRRKNTAKKEKLRQEKYTNYLNEKTKEIIDTLALEKEILLENNQNINECIEIAVRNRNKLWTREINDDDFMSIRLGIGKAKPKLELRVPAKKFELYEDNLFEEVQKIAGQFKMLENVPITLSLVENSISSIICDTEFREEYINGLLLQLMTHHSCLDMKIICLTSKKNEEKFAYLKNSPHCWNDDKTLRYFASSLEEIKILAIELEKEYQERYVQADKSDFGDEEINKKEVYKAFKPYYLIITDNFQDVKTVEFFNTLINSKKNYGYSVLLVSSTIQQLPNTCDIYMYVQKDKATILKKEINSQSQIEFMPEYVQFLKMEKYMTYFANVPVEVNNGLSVLPNMLSFLEMYGIGRMEQLNILNKWKTSDPINTLAAPIGVYANGDLFKLDLHEKKHGPHGLVAGSTGSGKSEFIISYILSMAINYHPDYVQFILIDYKGGGLAGAFESRERGQKIPHLAGTITNLDADEMNRTLVSIQSEMKRRQKKFDEIRDSLGESTMDIYKYQKLYREGVIAESISHLFIISDEFAELKSQQPEFMDQLISAARIGRSLGIHLILATQKPSGVVNEQIWSNARFKICLRVQSKADSVEMLKRDEAASIKEAGRFYLQVGYNELFEQGQSAWGGAKYIPSDRVTKKVDNSIEFIDNVGNTTNRINDIIKTEKEEDQGEQITNIVRYLIEIAQKENLQPKQLWLDALKEEIFILDLKEKYQFVPQSYDIKAVVGEYDSPSDQTQGLAVIDFTNKGNTIIYGEAGSGKENLIRTIISSIAVTHTPHEANFYLVDYASETLKIFDKLPHVGDVVYSEESEKLNNLISTIEKEIDHRKKLFENYMGSYTTYIKESPEKAPQIIVVISGFDILIENQPRAYERLTALFRDCNKYGICFVLTVTTAGSFRYRLAQLFPNKLCLQMQDKTEYRSLLGAEKHVQPSKKFGRGLIEANESILEFQTATLCRIEEINQAIKDYGEKAFKSYNYKAPRIKVLPTELPISALMIDEIEGLEKIPIGLKKSNLDILNYNFLQTPVLPIVTNFLDEEFAFIKGIIALMRSVPNVKVRVIDFLKIYEKSHEDVPVYHDDFDTIIQQVDIELDKEDTTERTTVFIFVGIGSIKQKIDVKYHPVIEKVFKRITDSKKNVFLTVDNYITYRNIENESWYISAIDQSTGIWLGDGVTNQLSIKASDISRQNASHVFKDMGYLVIKGKSVLFKHIIDKERNTNE